MTTSDDVSSLMPQPAGVLHSLDLDRLDHLAAALINRIPAGTTFGLVGTLGAGKTALVRAIARACGVDVADVTSPTFTLLQTHRGSLAIHHLDAYRLADEDEFWELGVEELFDDDLAWTLVEWADRVANVMPAATLWLHIAIEATEPDTPVPDTPAVPDTPVPDTHGPDTHGPDTHGPDHADPYRSVTLACADPTLAGIAREIAGDLA